METPVALYERAVSGCSELLKRLDQLRDHHGRVADEIHAIRKLGKKIRGSMVGIGAPKPGRQALTAVARMLAGQRDAVSRHTTWRRLGLENAKCDEAAAAIEALLVAQEKAASHRVPDAAVAWAKAQVELAQAALDAMPTDKQELKVQQGQLKLERRLAKRLAKLVGREPNAERLHEARKAVKACLGGWKHKQKELREIAELLGDDNDLSVLEDWLDAHGFNEANAGEVRREIEKRHHKLRAKIHGDARKLLETLCGASGVA